MRYCGLLLLLAALVIPSLAQDDPEGPANEKARKTYKHALDDLQHHMTLDALDNFKKADKQDDGHCLGCQKKMIKYGIELRDWKTAETAGEEMIAEAQGDKALAIAHYELGFVLRAEALEKHKEEIFARAHQEMSKALATYANFPDAVFVDGQILAQLKQDDAAKAQFEQFVKMRPADDPDRQRALRYISAPDLARARMAPAFSVTTTDGQRVSLDELKGRVVLIDFWATWCGPCREALPHMRDIARKFQGQPLLILSVSLDDDEQKWKDFVAKNQMTWPQYRDGGFDGPIAHLFAVSAIPQTFTIDADGVLQDQHIGDAAIEGKLEKLVGRARESPVTDPPKR
ncbi:MAG: TlpA family protein disulfide reductase [Acidobacteriia bacterium]|nr:TlpA family protein disulfide reductase [Terriglobia bacterium]